MGEVFLGLDPQLNRKVALKVLRPDLPGHTDYVERFRREAQAAANLSHPGIVPIYGIDREGEITYFAMEYVGERSLLTLLREVGPLPAELALDYARQAAEALRYAHDQGIIHRDVKPGNLLLAEDGRVKICDFGLAKQVKGDDSSLTLAGTILGSPNYMAPEQSQSKAVDHRSDIYALGATLFTLISGRPPFERESQLEVLMAHIDQPAPRPEELVGLADGRAIALLEKMMAKDPAERPQTYGALLAEMDGVAGSGQFLKWFIRGLIATSVIIFALIAIDKLGDRARRLHRARGNSVQPTPTPTPTSGADSNGNQALPPQHSAAVLEARQAVFLASQEYRYAQGMERLRIAMENPAVPDAWKQDYGRELGRVLKTLQSFKTDLIGQVQRKQSITIRREDAANSMLTVMEATEDHLLVRAASGGAARRIAWKELAPREVLAVARQCFDRDDKQQEAELLLFMRVYRLRGPGGDFPPARGDVADNRMLQRALLFLSGDSKDSRDAKSSGPLKRPGDRRPLLSRDRQ